MTTEEVRTKFLNFYQKKNHALLPSAPLVPENDSTTLFTGSGMQPMLPYLLGKNHPLGSRLADSQKCFRSGDIEDIGDNRHTTFFEMLGNWSLGDYFKTEQLTWLFEFLTDELKLNPNNLYVTVFAGEPNYDLPQDEESAKIWQQLFATKDIVANIKNIGREENGASTGFTSGDRIFYYNASKNWWSRSGKPDQMPIGEPGGPDSEIFYEFTDIPHDPKFGQFCQPNCDCGRFMEISNSVFMAYVKTKTGFDLLPQPNVDFGGGLERLVAATNNESDIFKIDTLNQVILKLEKLTKLDYDNEENKIAFRIIADHLRASAFLIADGVRPGTSDQGYFVRRLIRRAVRYLDKLNISEINLIDLLPEVLASYKEAYPETFLAYPEIKTIIQEEENKFRETLKLGLNRLKKELAKTTDSTLKAEVVFDLYQSFGFPLELTKEEVEQAGLQIDLEQFYIQLKKHKDLSRQGSLEKFKGGLVDHSGKSLKYHTATHLLHQALREVLGSNVSQKGSNITPERLRFDFSFDRKLTTEELRAVEDIVKDKIEADLPVLAKTLTKNEAMASGALHLFGDKYGETVTVYFIGPDLENAYSKEFCGGPHVDNTSELGQFKIIKEEAVAKGIRRIKAVLT